VTACVTAHRIDTPRTKTCSTLTPFLVALAVTLLASACATSAPPTAEPGVTPQAMPSGTQVLKAGTYAFAFPEFDAPGKPFPHAVITVPNGWMIEGGFALTSHVDTPRHLAVTIWNVVDVYTNGCHWLGPMIHPGPTVDALAAVLAARPLRNATAPVSVSFGGYNGKYLEWSVPIDIQFSDCDGGKFKSWTDAEGDRYQQGPGQVDRLWILDVEGHRLLIDATYMPGTTEQDRAELAKVVNSIAFKR
jgi:hypothetical protein